MPKSNLKMSELETARLYLREFRPIDLTAVVNWEGTPHAEKFLEFCLRSYREWGMGPWALLLKEAGVIVGNCGFCRIRYDRLPGTFEYCGEVNYYIAPQHRGQGFASEALMTIVRFGFGELRLTRIQGRCTPENIASQRVLEKAGLHFERKIPGATEGSPEENLYAITREHFQTLQSHPQPGAH